MRRKVMLSALLSLVVIVSVSVGAFAESKLQTISAYLNKGVTLNLNGQEWQAKNQSGERQYPITYEGSTYLPVRAVGEAVGVEIGWDGETETVFIGSDGKVKEPSAASTRSNPTAIGAKADFDLDGVIDNYGGSVTVNKVIRGSEAWKIIEEANMFNDEPEDGYEYILAEITVDIDRVGKEGAQVSISPVHFTLVSSEGRDYDTLIGVSLDNDLRTSLYEGASHTGWVAFLVKTDDVNPLITYARDYDGTGGVWFKTK